MPSVRGGEHRLHSLALAHGFAQVERGIEALQLRNVAPDNTRVLPHRAQRHRAPIVALHVQALRLATRVDSSRPGPNRERSDRLNCSP